MILKIKVWIKNILVATLAAAVIFGFTPQMEQPAYADATGVDFSSYVNTTTTVKFNGIDWYIIGDSTKGVRPEEGTVTLLSKKYTEATRFNSNTSDNVYKTSLIKKTLDSVFSRQYKDVSPAVKSVDLTDVEVTGANLWLLSWEEAKILTNAVLYCENNTGHALMNNGWWLRTPDSDETRALLVVDADTAIPIIFPIRISNLNGLRPALKLDLRNVDFDTETNTFNLVDSPILTHKHDNIEFSEWSNELAKTQNGEGKTAGNSLPGSAGSYYLTQDVDLGSSSWEVPAGTTNLCLNGHNITSTEDDDGTVVLNNSYSTLNLYDEHTGESAGAISSKSEDGVLLKEDHAAFNMYGGKISNCDDYGVDLDDTGTSFNMYNGEISSCYDGVYVDSDADFTLHKGVIKGNLFCGVKSYGTTRIENGSITNNKTGVNTSQSTKGIILQGSNISPQITGNTEHNLLLDRNGDLKIQISDGTTISGDARIDVYPTNGTSPVTGIFTAGLSGKIQGDKTAADIFKSDDDGYFVSAAENGEAQLEKSEQPAVDPVGNIDVVAGKEGSIDVAGWAFDPSDTKQSIDVHVYIGGEAGTAGAEGHALTANLERADVDKVYECGKYHGFGSNITTDKRGEQPVYIYAINIGEGKNVLLGSVTVTISEIQYPLNIDPGEGAGTCKIYVYAHNGVSRTVNVTVK